MPTSAGKLALCVLVACADAAGACAGRATAPAAVAAGEFAPRARPPRPAGCTEVPAGGALQPWVDGLPPGGSLCLAPGEHLGPVGIATTVTIWGPPSAVVVSRGAGTLVNVTAPGAKLLGFGMRMTGRRQEREAAVLRIRADDALVEGVELRDVAFGVHVDGASRVRLRGNHITGAPSALTGMRGDAVRLWETSDSFVEANAIAGARDVVVWYSPRNTFRRNHITRGRYGMHFMYSADNAVSDNHVEGCVVGAFVMYSRGILLHDNHFIDASGAAGMGVGLKESGNVTLRGNWFVHDTIGLYLDTSPLYLGDHNLVDGNRFLFTNAAVVFHGRAERNEFRGNELRANRRQVEVEGGGDALDSRWSGNAFDDYVGYDLDRDGVGDVPYTLRSVTGELAARFPQLRYFQGSPALGIVEAVAHLVPLVAPRTLLVDARPRFAAVAQAHGGNATSPGGS